MKANRTELAALAQVAGPQLTAAEIETKKLIAEMERVEAQIAATPPDVRMERSAAVLSGILTPADAEAVRAFYWSKAKLSARRVAVMAGNMPKERADDALAKFNAFERGRVHVEIEKLISELRQIQRCMNGGNVPAPVGGVQ